jgi:6-phosphogluconolactonase
MMTRLIRDIRVYANPLMLAKSAAEEFFERALQSHANGKIFSCALSGGSTPSHLFEYMSDQATLARLPAGFWNAVHFFWSDERDAPSNHPDSNYRLAREILLSKIDIPDANIHPMHSKCDSAAAAATAYESELKRFFALLPEDAPRLDLIFLGLGDDGHTASLFPHSEALNEKTRLVSAPWVEKINSYRITLTLPAINNAACIAFLIQGIGKADIVRRVLTEDPSPDKLPAQMIQPNTGELLWLLDHAAAAKLNTVDTKQVSTI